tara:strand:- start:10170 stop:10787 length:618 start_codon:yes stop_codon:yes gene_type:complete
MRNIIKSLPIENLQYLFEGRESFLRKLKMDNVAVYSMTPLEESKRIAEIISSYVSKKGTITDMTACVGGDTIRFSHVFKHINAIEISSERCQFLQHNVETYGCKNVSVFQGNCLEMIHRLKQDVIYIDPPWGGKKYKYKKKVNLYLSTTPMWSICNNLQNLSKIIVLKVPLNFNEEFFVKKLIYDKEKVKRYVLEKMQLIIIENS